MKLIKLKINKLKKPDKNKKLNKVVFKKYI